MRAGRAQTNRAGEDVLGIKPKYAIFPDFIN